MRETPDTIEARVTSEGAPLRRLPSALPRSEPAQAYAPESANGAEPDERPRWWRDQLRRRMLAAADALVAALIGAGIVVAAEASWAWALVPLPVSLLTAKLLGLYDHDHRAIRHMTLDELPQLSALVATTVLASVLLIPGGDDAPTVVGALFGGAALSLAGRAAARSWWRSVTPPERTLVVGEGTPAVVIRRKVELFADMHLELAPDLSPAWITAPNGTDPLARIVSEVDRVVVAWNEADPTFIELLVELCRDHQTKLSVVSPFRGRARPARRVSSVADVPVLEYNTWDIPRSTAILKRTFDTVVAGFGLVAMAPLFVVIAAAIKLDDRGPVLFRQRRAGAGGRPFEMVKFRSMVVGAEARLGDLVQLEELKDPMFKLRRDPRITRVGRSLRRFSLDELPQLWNVLKGEMSLVGPRPEELSLVQRYRPEHNFRLAVKPGITGPMQVFGRGELTFEERLAVEIDYVENVSLALDFRLLAATVPSIIRGTGAF